MNLHLARDAGELKYKSIGVLQHNGLIEEWGISREHVPVNKTPEVVIYQVEVIALTGIVSQTEVPNEFIFGVHVLDKYIGRELGADHDLCLHVDRMNIQQVI